MNVTKRKLKIYVGSMFSGKTFAVLRELSQLSEMGLRVIYINHSLDDRSDTIYSSHSTLMRSQEIDLDMVKIKNLVDCPDLSTYDVIAIDEAQFFEKFLVDFVKHLVEVKNKYVIVCGLDGDYNRNKFGHVLDLIPYADSVVKLHAFCKRCSESQKVIKNALFTYCQHKSTADAETSINIGGADKYMAVCRECYLELHK